MTRTHRATKLQIAMLAALAVATQGCGSLGKKSPEAPPPQQPSDPIQEGSVKITPPKPEKPSAALLADLGFFQIESGQLPKAEDYFRKSLEADRKHALAYVGLARVYTAQKRGDKAKEMVAEGLKRQPKSAELHNELAVLRAQQGDLAGGIAALEKAVELAPANELFILNLAGMLAMNGQFDEAYDVYVRVISPGEARYRIAGLLYHQKQTRAAVAQLEAGLQEEPGHLPSAEMVARLTGREAQTVGYRPSNSSPMAHSKLAKEVDEQLDDDWGPRKGKRIAGRSGAAGSRARKWGPDPDAKRAFEEMESEDR